MVIPVPLLLIYFFGCRVRDTQEREAAVNRFRYGFLYENYFVQLYWFEIFWVLKRLLFTAVSITPRGIETTTLPLIKAGVSSIFLASMIVQLQLQPFVRRAENLLDLACNSAVLVTFNSYFGDSQQMATVAPYLLAVHALPLLVLVYGMIWPAGRRWWKKREARKKFKLELDEDLIPLLDE